MMVTRFGLGSMLAGVLILAPVLLVSGPGPAQEMPRTRGEMLSGKPIVLADEVRGHPAVLVAGFSREGGNGTGAWDRAAERFQQYCELTYA